MSTNKSNNNLHLVQNQWGGSSAPWNPGGIFLIGSRDGQNVVALNVTSADGGKTLTGTMTYAREGQIGFRATMTLCNNYAVENQWGGSSAPWNPGGTFVLGSRGNQRVVAINISSADNGNTLTGSMTYAGEGPIGFKSQLVDGGAYSVLNSWGSSKGNPGGIFIMGGRAAQNVVAVNISSTDGGNTLSGTMTYAGEGPIGFTGKLYGANNYVVENSWGGTSGHPGGTWLIGSRESQNVVALNISSSDGGATLSGDMTYAGEGHIGFIGNQL
ncbi:MAG: lectin ESA-2 [Bacteroidetes bacterium]|nr:lectin ESA-2 [Bacteroidota bacterium]